MLPAAAGAGAAGARRHSPTLTPPPLPASLSHRAAFFQRLGARLRHDLFSVAHDFRQDGLYVYKRPVRSGERRCGCRLLWQYGLLLCDGSKHHIGSADHRRCCIAGPSGHPHTSFTQPPPAGEGTERGALLAAAGSVFHHAVLYVKRGEEVRGHWLGLPRAWCC